jgi:peptide/nickel transport system ATP-binding protein
MRQRVVIAVATILKPKVMYADEPSSALDVVAQRGVIQMLKKIQHDMHNTMVLVSHDMGVHANLTDRIAIMYAGKSVEVATTTDIFDNSQHPYTKYLIGSLPRVGDKSYRVSAPGSPPPLDSPPQGCRFHPRCPHAMDVCKRVVPVLREVAPAGHNAACHWVDQQLGLEPVAGASESQSTDEQRSEGDGT